MSSHDRFARIEVRTREELRAWLAANHAQPESIWLVTWRKGSGQAHLGYDAIVEEALCFGWVDSLPRRLDADRTMLLLSPRRPGSAWSGVNKRRVAALIAAGLMAEPGLAAIRRAEADGSWSVLDGASALAVPPDLAAALAATAGAAEAFAAFPPSARRAILEWIALAKRPATRAARVAETAAAAARGERANAWKRPRT